MLTHLKVLSESFSITLVVNAKEYPLSPSIDPRVCIMHYDIARKISLSQDIKTLFWLWKFFLKERFVLVHSMGGVNIRSYSHLYWTGLGYQNRGWPFITEIH
jgi:hypothetical protein